MEVCDAIKLMPSLIKSEQVNERVVDFAKCMGIYYNGRESCLVREYSGYMVASAPKEYIGRDVFFATQNEANALQEQIEAGQGRRCDIMPIWIYYSASLERVTWRLV